MTMCFIPPKRTFFYVSARPRQRTVGDFMSETVITVKDNSYRDQIFTCTGTDSTHVVAQRVFGGYLTDGKPYLFPKDMWEFAPVGPDVALALNLDSTMHSPGDTV